MHAAKRDSLQINFLPYSLHVAKRIFFTCSQKRNAWILTWWRALLVEKNC